MVTGADEVLERAKVRRRARLFLARNLLLAVVLLAVTVWCWPLLVEAVLPVFGLIAHVVTVMWGWLS